MELRIAVLFCLAYRALAYPSGAPNGACGSLSPSHGAPPQTDPSPYTITASESCYTPGEILQVTISANATFFIGFLIKGVTSDESADVGTFFAAADMTTQTRCSGHGLTHTSTGLAQKSSLTVSWQAPAAGTGDVKFLATIVRERVVYWRKLPSGILPECPPMCEDKLSDSRPITVKDGDEDVVITSCSELVKCYPSVCETQGLIGGVCCQECKKVGTPDCLDIASKCTPLSLTVNGEQKDITKCKKTLKKNKYKAFCSVDVFGSRGCCNFCKNKCVDSPSWKSSHRKCKDCTCADLGGKKLKKCCEKDWKGIGKDGKEYGCRAACCKKCTKKGFPPM